MRISKNVFTLIIFMSFAIISFAQKSYELDKKNGFKHFKLGKDFLEYQNELEYLGEISENEKIYEYIKGEIESVLNVKFQTMYLYFYKGKLVMIEFEFGKDLDAYSLLTDNLKIAFGKPYYSITTFDKHPQLFFASQWQGEKVVMSAFQYNLNNIEEYQKNVMLEIKIMDKEKKLMLDGF